MAFGFCVSVSRLRLLRGVKQAQQIGGCAGKNLLERRAVCPYRLHHAAEGGQHGVLGIDFQDGMFFGDEPVLQPAAGDFAVETDPMLMPAGFRVWRVAMPDSGKKQERVAGFDARGDIGFRFKFSPAAGNINERKSVEDAPVLPVERETFRVAAWWIDGVRPDTRFASGGGVKPPILIASADRKIAMERSGAGFHGTTEGLISSPIKSSFQLA